jgi:uncharacterized membrane protein YidH (DUF202 family)
LIRLFPGTANRCANDHPAWRISLNPTLVLIAVLVLAAGFVVYCEVDLARATEVRYLPKWAWAILCLGIGLTIPFGGIAYLVFGKVRRPRPPETIKET